MKVQLTLEELGTPFFKLGIVTKGNVVVDGEDFGGIESWKTPYNNELGARMNE